MPLFAVLLSILAFGSAALLSVALSEVGRRLGRSVRPGRLSRKDERWLAGQEANGESA